MADVTFQQILDQLRGVGGLNDLNAGTGSYPLITPNNPAFNDPSLLYPDLTGAQFSPSPAVGRIGTGGNKTASRTLGQLRGVGRGVQDILPGLLNSIYRGMLVQSPEVTEGNLKLLQMLGPLFAQAEGGMERIGREGEAQTDLSLLRGSGKDITAETLARMKESDPEFFALRESLAGKYGDLLSGMDPNQLTGAELTNAERSLNRSNIGEGTANTGSNSAALKGALQFDDRLQKKRMNLNSVLTGLSSSLPSLRSGAFNYGTATGQIGRDTGKSQFNSSLQGPQQIVSNLASNAFGQGGGIAQNVAQIQHSEIPSWQNTLGAIYGGINAIGSIAGAGR